LGQMTYWYNSNHLKMDAGLYEGFLYGHWAAILEKTGCLPLKIENDGFMAKTSQVVIEYKEEKIEDKIFELPEFKEISANPMN